MNYTVTVLPPGNKGRNARGICSHKMTRKAKRQKKQYVPGNVPTLRNSRPRFDAA